MFLSFAVQGYIKRCVGEKNKERKRCTENGMKRQISFNARKISYHMEFFTSRYFFTNFAENPTCVILEYERDII